MPSGLSIVGGRMKVGRNQRAQLAERIDAPASAFQREMRSVLRHTRALRRLANRGAGGGQPFVDAFDQIVRGHGPASSAENCGFQEKSQNFALGDHEPVNYRFDMPYDPERVRRAIRKIQKEKGLKMSAWARKAGQGERTLAEFLAGKTGSPTLETLHAFADAAEVHVVEIMGLEPREVDAQLSVSALRSMTVLLERVAQEQEGSGEALKSIRELALAIAQETRRG